MELNTLKTCIGPNIRYYRQLRQMSQICLAHRCDLSEPYISELETGKANLTTDTLNKVANTLEVEVEDLCGRR